MKESVIRGHRKMRYSFSSCSSLPCISLLITHGSGGGCVYARMRGITPARPQFETRPLLMDVIEVPRPLNKTGLYLREASIRGNTVHQWPYTIVTPLLISELLLCQLHTCQSCARSLYACSVSPRFMF